MSNVCWASGWRTESSVVVMDALHGKVASVWNLSCIVIMAGTCREMSGRDSSPGHFLLAQCVCHVANVDASCGDDMQMWGAQSGADVHLLYPVGTMM